MRKLPTFFPIMSVRLNSDQEAALEAVKRGENIFLSGPAGSGKSTLVKAIVEWSFVRGRRCSVSAMTGCAALLLGCRAKTLHSWAGIGLGRGTAEVLAAEIAKSPYAKKRWKQVDILVVDEISMMTPELFEKLDFIGKKLRGNQKPWGGIQLILCGDFFQLPPISKGVTGRYVFDSPLWKTTNLTNVLLKRIERQTDPTFQTLLNEARVGKLSEASIAILKERQGLEWKQLKIRPTLLFSKNADVDTINEANLTALKKPIRVFEASTVVERPASDPTADIPTGELLERLVARMDADSSYTPRLELCEGCQVMLVFNQNMEKGLVNGSRGVVIGFNQETGYPVVEFKTGDTLMVEPHEWESNDSPCLKRLQIPLRVAYAVTIHKSQGATLDCALIDIGSSTFECGQAYVALSRVRNLESLYVWNFNPARVMADPRVFEFYKSLEPEVEEEPEIEEAEKAEETEETEETEEDEAEAEPVPTVYTLPSSKIHSSWQPMFDEWLANGGTETLRKVSEARKDKKVYPREEDVFAVFQTPLTAIRVVIVAQDPYHGEGQAMGLAFSVPKGVKMPPSLKNIRKELITDVGNVWEDGIGDLTPWQKQGVFLMNTVLTVEEGDAASHSIKMGWEELTSRALIAILKQNPDVVFLAWGKFAQNLIKHLPEKPKHVLEAGHPSPLSASKGFFGSRPFTKTNALLSEPIDWTVGDV